MRLPCRVPARPIELINFRSRCVAASNTTLVVVRQMLETGRRGGDLIVSENGNVEGIMVILLDYYIISETDIYV